MAETLDYRTFRNTTFTRDWIVSTRNKPDPSVRVDLTSDVIKFQLLSAGGSVLFSLATNAAPTANNSSLVFIDQPEGELRGTLTPAETNALSAKITNWRLLRIIANDPENVVVLARGRFTVLPV